MLSVSLGLLILLYCLVLIPAVQTKLVSFFTGSLSKQFNTEISVGRVYFKPFRSVVLDNVLIRDRQNDTLMFVKSLHAGIDSVFYKGKRLYLSNLDIQQPLININKQDSVFNFSFLLDALKGDSTAGDKWHFNVQSVALTKGDVLYDAASSNGKHLRIRDVDFALSDIDKDSLLSFSIDELSLEEEDGLKVQGASGYVQAGTDELTLSNSQINTYNSKINLDSLNIKYDTKLEGQKQIRHFYIGLKPSYISNHDVGLFVDLNKLGKLPFNLSGQVFGSIDNIKGRNVRFDFGEESSISTSFDINGLPDFDQTFLYLNINDLSTTPSDLQHIVSYNKDVAFQFPRGFDNMQKIHYKGNLTGFLTDLVAFGQFNTSMGTIRTDIGLKFDKAKGLVFAGNLATSGFNIGKIFNASKNLDNLCMKVSIQGSRKSQDSFYAYMSGTIDTLAINQYSYKNISLNGLFANQKFDGYFELNDPNGHLDFKGKIDMSTEVPNFNFSAVVENAKLDKLNILPDIPNNHLSFNVTTDYCGNDLNDIIGNVSVHNASFISSQHDVRMDSLILISERKEEEKHISLQSDILEGNLTGTYNFTYLRQLLIKKLGLYLPALSDVLPRKDVTLRNNDFTFSCRLKKVSKLVNLLKPDLKISNDGVILGKFNTKENFIELNVELGEFRYNNLTVLNPEIQLASSGKTELSVNTRFKEILYKQSSILQNLSLHQRMFNDSILFNANWNNWSEVNNSGSIDASAHIKAKDGGLYASIDLAPSYIMVKDSIWEIQETRINYHPSGFSMKNFRIHHKDQELGINGFLHQSAPDGMQIYLQNIPLGDIISNQQEESTSVDGLLNGSVHVEGFYRKPIISSRLQIEDFIFNKDEIGDFYLKTDYLPDQNKIGISSKVKKANGQPLAGGGYLDMESMNLNLDYKLDSLQVGFLNLYLKNILQNLSGTVSGQLSVRGPLTAPELIGGVNINKAFFDMGLLQTTYSVSDSVIFTPHQMDFRSLTVHDRYGHQGVFDGTIDHTGFSDMSYNLVLIADNMLVMDTKSHDNPLYYGTVYADGNMAITGTTDDIYMDISGQTKANTLFYIPLSSEEVVEETNFIRFVKPLDEFADEEVDEVEDYQVDFSGMTITMDLNINPEAQTQVIFDSKIGDILKGSGNGNLQIKMDKEGGINFFGDFSFVEGDYLFTLQNVLNKRFIINPGSTVRWDGEPYDAIIDLNATYKLKTSLYDLVKSSISDETLIREYSRRIPVNCNLLLTDRLMKPAIKFQIETPSAQKNNQDVIDAYINTDEELNRQVLSLLVLNRFYSDENLAGNSMDGNRSAGNNAAIVTTAEMLSNQLSHWLSQMSNDFDIGISYRPGDEGISNDEIEVALSTQVFNNRVTINGNVGYGEDNTRTSDIIGDFDVDIKLNKSGNLRAKAYTQTNNDIIYNEVPTRQGVGVSFREEFDSLSELLHQYWLKITGGAKKMPEKKNND